MSKPPDFSEKTKDILAKRAGQKCSNPDCKITTSRSHVANDKYVNLGEAAHIKAARKGARYDENMVDRQRSDISNGIWLCRTCAKLIDSDEKLYTVELLQKWKNKHEESMKNENIDINLPLREIKVANGGIGSIIKNEGNGIGLEIINNNSKSTAEKISVEGTGVGEITINTGNGIGKKITSTNIASENIVNLTKSVPFASGLIGKVLITTCQNCKKQLKISKTIQGFSGENEPKIQFQCPNCKFIGYI